MLCVIILIMCMQLRQILRFGVCLHNSVPSWKLLSNGEVVAAQSREMAQSGIAAWSTGVCDSPLCNFVATTVPGSSYLGHARRWGLCSSRGLFVNSRVRFVRVVRVSPVCISGFDCDHSAPATMINGDYRGQNASVVKHNQSALGDMPAT